MSYKTVAALAFTSMFSVSTLLSPAHAEEQEKALNFGIISTESQQNLKPQWEPFLKDMEKSLGVKVNAFFAPDYAGIIQGMRFNKVDIAWYGNLSAMEAVDRANGQVFAQTVAADGSPGYWSVLIVNKDSPINNLNDLIAKRKDLTFGNGDPNSTSGFLVPGYYVFAKNNISASDFKRTVNAGHETNALAVANKQVDVATNNTENLDKLKTSAPEKLKELKVIWKSPLIVARRFFLHQNAINFALPEGAKKTHSAQCKNERKECLVMLLLSRITFVESRQADPIFESYITM